MGKIGNQSSDPQRSIEQVNCKSDDQSSDLQRSVEATANMVTKAHKQAHGKASPCGYRADHEHL